MFRHALRKKITIIIKSEQDDPSFGPQIPFDVAGMRVLFYDASTEERLENSKAQLERWLLAGLNFQAHDSLVFASIPGLNVSRRTPAIRDTEEILASSHQDLPCQFGVVTGDLISVHTVDAWANPENTKMEMGRLHDSSVSSNIRFHGAKRDRNGFVTQDVIADSLKQAMKGRPVVEAGTVIPTPSGELKRTNKVSLLLHVAAFQGQPGKGYAAISDLPGCIANCLTSLDEHNRKVRVGRTLSSVLFPLFGTWSGNDPQDIVDELLNAAIAYAKRHRQTSVKKVVFLSYTERDLDLCETAFVRRGFNLNRL